MENDVILSMNIKLSSNKASELMLKINEELSKNIEEANKEGNEKLEEFLLDLGCDIEYSIWLLENSKNLKIKHK